MPWIVALWLASAVGPEVPQTLTLDDEPARPSVSPFVGLRAGAWIGRGFSFTATRTDSVRVDVDATGLLSGGVDLGLAFSDKFLVFATAEASGTDDVRAEAAGLYVGWRERPKEGHSPGIPDDVTVYAGGMWGRYEVQASGFGDFDDAIGFGAGVRFGWKVSRVAVVGLVGEYRLLEFDYEPEVLEGDSHAGGSSGWIGASFELRF